MNLNEYKILELMNRLKKPLFFRELSKKSGVSIDGRVGISTTTLGMQSKDVGS